MELPTLGAFVEKAIGSHPITEDIIELDGPDGRETHRMLRHRNGSYAVLPKIDDKEQLNRVVFANLCRRLQIPALDFGIPPGFLTNPLRPLWEND